MEIKIKCSAPYLKFVKYFVLLIHFWMLQTVKYLNKDPLSCFPHPLFRNISKVPFLRHLFLSLVRPIIIYPTFSEMYKTPTSVPWFEYKTFSQKACVFKAWSPDSVAI